MQPLAVLRSGVAILLILVLAAGCAGGVAPRGQRTGEGMAPREDIVIVPSFTAISGLAVGRRFVFITSPFGIGIFDRRLRRWLPPLAAPEGVALHRVGTVAAEPWGDAVWIGAAGVLLIYDPTFDVLRRANLPGDVDVVAFDSRDPGGGAYVRAAGAWARVSSTGLVRPLATREVPPREVLLIPPTYDELAREFPGLRAIEPLLTRDEGQRSWPVSAVGRAPMESEVWLGTWGNGVYEVDPLFARGEQRPFGLLGASAGALALDAAGVWVATAGGSAVLGIPERGGLTFASADLQEWRWIAPAMGQWGEARVRDLVVRDGSAWLATARGLFVVEVVDRALRRPVSAVTGLPSDQVLSLVARPEGIWAGTAGGLAFVPTPPAGRGPGSPSAESAVIAGGTPVHDLLFVGDTLWMASAAGLLLLPPRAGEPLRLPGADPRLSRPIRALAHSDSVVTVALDEELLQLGRSGASVARMVTVDARALGGLTALAMDGATVWAGGPHGLLIVSRSTGVARLLRVPRELPGEVHDVALDEDVAWVSTAGGLLRLRRLRDGTVP